MLTLRLTYLEPDRHLFYITPLPYPTCSRHAPKIFEAPPYGGILTEIGLSILSARYKILPHGTSRLT